MTENILWTRKVRNGRPTSTGTTRVEDGTTGSFGAGDVCRAGDDPRSDDRGFGTGHGRHRRTVPQFKKAPVLTKVRTLRGTGW